MLNDYRDQAHGFLNCVDPGADLPGILRLFREELDMLQHSVDEKQLPSTRHQIYDLLFLVMEMAAVADVDLDAEWQQGLDRKRMKYFPKSPRFIDHSHSKSV